MSQHNGVAFRVNLYDIHWLAKRNAKPFTLTDRVSYYTFMPAQNFVVEGKEGIVIGGGSVAMDTARTALRLGAKKVTCVCLEEGDNVPAHPWEVKEALEEGIEFIEGYSPKAYTGRINTLEGIDFAKVVDYKKDDRGKITFNTDNSDTIHLSASFAIVAIGQYADNIFPEADGESVFYAGDIAGGPQSVIDAIASGRKAAFDVDSAIQQRTLRQSTIGHELVMAPKEEKIFPCNRRKTIRHKRPMQDASLRIQNFDDVEFTYTDRQFHEETLRCLGCGCAVIDEDLCVGCGICTTKCKFDAIRLEKTLDNRNKPYYQTLMVAVGNAPATLGRLAKKKLGL